MKLQSIMLAASMAALATASQAHAQTTSPATNDQPEARSDEGNDVVVTGSRIEIAGFDQPTPTTVVGEIELRQGARPNIQQVLNDLPQFKATTVPQSTGANVGTGTAPADLRGLGAVRTLTLIDGRRFVGQNNLNFIPANLVKRVEVVTGGASAAWGSGAIAGVVNLILNDTLEGVSVGASNGISSRGDVHRYTFDGSFGTRFADGRGHVMIGAEYVRDEGTYDSQSRPNNAAGIFRVNPASTTDLSTQLVRDVNYGNLARDGLIVSGVLAGQVFNPDGSLRAFRGGTQVGTAAFNAQMIGGEDGISLNDQVAVSGPFGRFAAYGRVSFDLGGTKLWADGSYSRVDADNPKFIPELNSTPFTIQANNPFLSQAVRTRLAAAGQTTFSYGRELSDLYTINYDASRENKEVAVGIDGALGRFKYRGHYSHGVIVEDEKFRNSRITANFNRAIAATTNAAGQIVCAVNAVTVTDAACRPLNIFGTGNASADALAYTTGTQARVTRTKLDSAGVQLQGSLVNLWAGPLTVVVGGEWRRESISTVRDAFTAATVFAFAGASQDLAGSFTAKEAFGEAALPLLDVPGKITVDLNGAGRYSDYSNSGGLWAWKAGATVRLFDDILLRGTRSKDNRTATITDLFSTVRVGAGSTSDLDTAGRLGVIPGYVPNPTSVTQYTGGNPNLVPEVSKGTTLGVTWSPSFFRGFSASVDYYDLDIRNAITTLSASNLTLACARGSAVACAAIVRNPVTQTLEAVFANPQNVASFEVRGVDFELAYLLPLSRLNGGWNGSLRFRALASYVDRFIFDTRITRVDTAGDIGGNVANAIPDRRGTFSLTYDSKALSLDARVRYIDSGRYNSQLTTLVNNDVAAKTYLDLGAYFRVKDNLTVFGNVNNVFNVAPPLFASFLNTTHDTVGTYFTAGARIKF